MQMRHIPILVAVAFVTDVSIAQPQVTISLISESGVKNAEYLHFSISNATSTMQNFTFTKFSKNGKYANPNLFQYNETIDTGFHKMKITLKAQTEQNVLDTFFVDSTISRMEIFVFLSTIDTIGAFIKEVKTINYKTGFDYLDFSLIDKPKIGSKAAFKVLNNGERDVYGYPNSAFFFGTLYEEIGDDQWAQLYPLYTNIKYCDTTAFAKPLSKGKSTIAWTPNDKDCSEYAFTKKGNFFFELLYTTAPNSGTVLYGLTKINKIDVYRQISEFSI